MLCKKCAKCGDLELLKIFRHHGFPWNETVINAAAEGGYIDIIQWCIENGCYFDINSCAEAAASKSQLKVLQWLLSEELKVTQKLLNSSARSGQFEAVQWCVDNGASVSERTCKEAARSGNLKLLQWCLPSTDGKMTCDISSGAARSGNVQMLKWCLENKCPTNWEMQINSFLSFNPRMIEYTYLLENNHSKGYSTI